MTLLADSEREGRPWTCLTCGFIGDRQSCGNCGAESVPGSWVPSEDVDRLVSMLRECQSALTGPASLRQRIEDLIGPRHERPFPEEG